MYTTYEYSYTYVHFVIVLRTASHFWRPPRATVWSSRPWVMNTHRTLFHRNWTAAVIAKWIHELTSAPIVFWSALLYTVRFHEFMERKQPMSFNLRISESLIFIQPSDFLWAVEYSLMTQSYWSILHLSHNYELLYRLKGGANYVVACFIIYKPNSYLVSVNVFLNCINSGD